VRLLLVEDDPMLGGALRDHLLAHSHAVDWFQTRAESMTATLCTDYDAILLDLQLPDGDGLELLKALRCRKIGCAVIILTARDQISDRIKGLDAGADDYLTKPFDLHELEARLRALSRRTGNAGSSGSARLQIGALAIDLASRAVAINGQPVTVTAREWAVLADLARHAGTLRSKGQLEDALYAMGEEIESNVIEVHISHLRKKLGRGTIETVRGIGYRLLTA
jgi:two-component system, OmpR family, response regulator